MRFQQSVAGICLALLLVGGLVSMPTSCDCGAGIPHGHSLFILGGHYHSAEGAVFGAAEDEMEHHQHHNHESPSIEPQFAGTINHASDRVAVDLPAWLVTETNWQRISYPHDVGQQATGRDVLPDLLPPQAG